MNIIHSTLDKVRDRFAPISHTSTFRATGQVTPEEFVLAGDYIVYKFPTWSWSDASSPSKRVSYLPEGKQFLITRGVPCARRLGEGFAGEAGEVDNIVRDGFKGEKGDAGGEDDGWLQTGGGDGVKATVGDVRTLGEGGEVGEREEEEEEIPDMEDEDDDEAIIRDGGDHDSKSPLRSYTLYITYTPYYRTPRLFLSGSVTSPNGSQPLSPHLMMEDIVGDYADKTVTLEDFPFHDSGLKMASIHPCRHASVMKALLDRADAALKLRLEKMRKGQPPQGKSGMEGLVEEMSAAQIAEKQGKEQGTKAAGGGDEWEMLQNEGQGGEEEIAIRVDQYLVVFLKFMASVTPGMNYDFTMGV